MAGEQLVNQRPSLGKPLLEMCKGGWGCKGLPGWFGALFPTFVRLTEGGGLIILRANAKWRPFNHQTAVDTENIFTQCKGGVPRALKFYKRPSLQ